MWRVAILCLCLAACGSRPEPVLVSVQTYLDTPRPSRTTQLRAEGLCNPVSQRVRHRMTQRLANGQIAHIYECLPG